ncbi:Transposon Ty3-G Gag-Pol polyprotein [Senna tora]|uniref:Transposon Ty3-G Gag-Pol polyprotein n=1 Tax=Senna tora TaxID=362788 RepID=A0A835CEA7_9FABA|nr:Transposon Ty3-G Gag-Pol polyprotein [Senna tora]
MAAIEATTKAQGETMHVSLSASVRTCSGWYRWVKMNKTVQTWQEFVQSLLLRFGNNLYENPKTALKKLEQINDVEEYQAAFERLSTKVTGLEESWLVSIFVGGLKAYLQTEVVLGQPQTYYEAMSLAKFHQQKQVQLQEILFSPVAKQGVAVSTKSSTNSKPLPSVSIGSKQGVSITGGLGTQSSKPAAIGSNTPQSGPRRLTAAEIKIKRAKGEYYYCDEKWSKTHSCQSSVSLLLGPEELAELLFGDTVETDIPVIDPDKVEEVLALEISFNALEGQFHPSSMRVTGSYLGNTVVVLIDNGSTHNFIKREVAVQLQLPVADIKTFKVQVGSGAFLLCSQFCEAVPLKIQDHEIVVDLFVLDIKGSDVVLGVQWLAGLGDIVINHKELTLTFHSSQGITKLYDFQDVFAEPSILPPRRQIGHGIHLTPGSKPVSVRLYRYLHFQKNEIERLVEEMKAAGLIRDSQSKHFVMKTDHKSLRELMKQVIQTPEQQFYLSKLLRFQYDIVYRPGKTNAVADALSRLDEAQHATVVDSSCMALSVLQNDIFESIRSLNKSDPVLVEYHDKHQQQQLPEHFQSRMGYCFMMGEWLFLTLLWTFNVGLFVCFMNCQLVGMVKLRPDVLKWVMECLGLLQPIEIPRKPWSVVTMDFITALPSSSGFTVILVVLDKLTKVAHFGALKGGYTASKVAAKFVEIVVKLHGFPSRIISDRDFIFLSQFWRNLMQLSGTKLSYSTAYHPETDGQSEVVNRCLEHTYKHMQQSIHISAIGMAPYKALYGVSPQSILGYISALDKRTRQTTVSKLMKDDPCGAEAASFANFFHPKFKSINWSVWADITEHIILCKRY